MTQYDDDDYLYDDEAEDNNVLRWMPRLLLIIAVGGFALLAWYAYRSGPEAGKGEELLVIEADKTPVRETPENPGGMEVPNQDKTVFETISDAKPQPKPEKVLPAPEEPLDREEALKQPEPPAPAEKAEEKPQEKPAEKKEETKKEEKSENSYSGFFSAPIFSVKDDKPSKAAKEEATPPSATEKTGGTRVQLGAFKSEAEAAENWKKMSKDPLFAGKANDIVRADLGSKGTFFRLQATGFKDRGEARSFCKQLNDKNRGCFLVP